MRAENHAIFGGKIIRQTIAHQSVHSFPFPTSATCQNRDTTQFFGDKIIRQTLAHQSAHSFRFPTSAQQDVRIEILNVH